MTGFVDVHRTAMIYTADHLDDARAVFIFRPVKDFRYDHRDTSGQRHQLCDRLAGMSAEVDRWLDELGRTPAIYFDAVTQLQLTSWSRGRVALVGDAGYWPRPAVGGSASLAVIGARALAQSVARSILPSSGLGVRALIAAGQLISALPTPLTAALAGINSRGLRLYDSIEVPRYALTDV